MKKYALKSIPIKNWAEADRPREKLLKLGKQNLTDAELLAILIASGTPKHSALDVAKSLLNLFDQDLQAMGRGTLSQLKKVAGIGDAKAVTILAALELGRRRQLKDIREKPQIRSSQEAFDVIAPMLVDLPHEEFWVLILNRANRVIGRQRISTGGVSGTTVDSKMVFEEALLRKASGLILFHNHPSGNLQASQADINLTQKLLEAGKALDIAVLDHLIVSEKGYLSFADEGLI